MEIKGAHILITGANKGLGRAFAKSCAEDKAHIHLVTPKKDATLIKEMEDAGAASVTAWTADLASRSSVDRLVEALAEEKIDILVHGADVMTDRNLDKQNPDEIYEALGTNVGAVIHLTQALLPGMLRRRRGKIVLNSGVAAFVHGPGTSTYSATKSAVFAFAESLRGELRETKVSVLNLVVPAEDSLSPVTYAKMIREAVLNDLIMLEPQGLPGVTLKIAKYVPQVFDWGTRTVNRFRR